MIRLENLTKIFSLHGQHTVVADNINMTLPTGAAIGLLGRNGAGKSTLMRIISGNMDATSGRVLTTGSISYPVGFAGSFHGDLTGAQNTRFVARIYGVDSEELVHFVQEFAELGVHFHLPFRTYSSGMRSRLSFGVSMGIPFDTYLVDEVTSVGDASFKEKSSAVFKERMKNSGALFVSHSMKSVRELCDMAAILEHGKLTLYDDMDEAFDQHRKNMGTTEKKRGKGRGKGRGQGKGQGKGQGQGKGRGKGQGKGRGKNRRANPDATTENAPAQTPDMVPEWRSTRPVQR